MNTTELIIERGDMSTTAYSRIKSLSKFLFFLRELLSISFISTPLSKDKCERIFKAGCQTGETIYIYLY